MIDFGKPQLDPTATLHIRDVSGQLAYQGTGKDKAPITIELCSKDGEPVQAFQRKMQDEVLAGRGRKRVGEMTSEDLDRRALGMLAAATVSWSGVLDNGKPIPCEFDRIVELYRMHPWLTEQVDAFVNDRENFMRPS